MIIGHGIDIVDVERVNKLLNRFPKKFPERIFTAEEIDYCCGQSRPAESFAARLAGKEAVYKIMSPRLETLRWQEINIVCGKEGKPHIELRKETNSAANKMGINNWYISLSHEEKFSVASVIAEGGQVIK